MSSIRRLQPPRSCCHPVSTCETSVASAGSAMTPESARSQCSSAAMPSACTGPGVSIGEPSTMTLSLSNRLAPTVTTDPGSHVLRMPSGPRASLIKPSWSNRRSGNTAPASSVTTRSAGPTNSKVRSIPDRRIMWILGRAVRGGPPLEGPDVPVTVYEPRDTTILIGHGTSSRRVGDQRQI